MKKHFIHKIFIAVLLFSGKLVAQDITGMWKGEIYVDSLKLHLPYEISVSEDKGKYTGYSRVVFFKDGKQGGIEEPGIQDISIKLKDKEIIIEDEGFLEHNFSINPPKQVKKTMVLTLIVSDTEMVMTGTWSTNRTRHYLSATGTATLKRKIDFKSTALFKRLDTLKLVSKLSYTKPDKTLATAVIAAPVVPLKIEAAKPAPPIPEPELVIPAIAKVNFALVPVIKKPQPAVAKIQAPSVQRKNLYNSITKYSIKYTIPPPPAPIPAPVVTVAALIPKPEKAVTPVPVSKPKPIAPPVAIKTVASPKPTTTAPTAPVPKTAPVTIKTPEPVAVLTQPKQILVPIIMAAPSITQGAADLEKRTINTEQSVYFESDSLVLTLYDNGEVDGDTVTVVMNGNVIFSKVGLTTKANSKTIHINENTPDIIKLVMYAENLGEIPPNTGLLVVRDGEKVYDVRFTADLKSNAAIILRRKKKE